MTFAEWIEEKYERACETADESWMIAAQSYGTGYDKGYAAALAEIRAEMPYRAAMAPLERSPQGSEEANG